LFIPWTSSLIAAAAPTVDVADDGTWTGTIALVNEWSADNRMLALDDDTPVDVRPLPLPVTVQYVTGPGHDGATVGLMTLDEVWRDGPQIMGRGRIDTDDPQGAALARKIRGRFLRFVSADIDKVAGRMVCVGADGQISEDCDQAEDEMQTGELYTRWRIMGASLLAHPAFPEAQIQLAADQEPDEAAPGSDIVAYDPAWGCVRPDGADGWESADCDAEDAVPAGPTKDRPYDPEDATPAAATTAAAAIDTPPADVVPAVDTSGPLTAAAVHIDGWLPPTDWFRSPDLTELQPITVDPDGRVRGYLAAWGVTHRSFPGRTVTPPHSASGYALFNTRPIHTSEGLVDVGLITMGTGHASLGLDHRAAVAHYDDTGTMAAVVRAGEDSRGIWLAGAALPDLTDEQRLRLSLSRFSGDWRQEGTGLELVAALAVNTEGFPVPVKRRSEQGDYALVAAGALPAPSLAMEPTALDSTGPDEHLAARAEAAASRVRALRVHAAARRLRSLRTTQAADGSGDDEEGEAAGFRPFYVDAPNGLHGEEELANALEEYWKRGKGAAEIRWGTPGDWTRCHRHLTRHVGDERARRICSQWHHDVSGLWPGDARNP